LHRVQTLVLPKNNEIKKERKIDDKYKSLSWLLTKFKKNTSGCSRLRKASRLQLPLDSPSI
jgi:hypothetical protein